MRMSRKARSKSLAGQGLGAAIAVLDVDDRVALGFEGLAQDEADRGLVVGDQHAHGFGIAVIVQTPGVASEGCRRRSSSGVSSGSHLGVQRQVDMHACALAGLALDAHPPAVAVDPMAGDGEAEPGALGLGREEGRRQAGQESHWRCRGRRLRSRSHRGDRRPFEPVQPVAQRHARGVHGVAARPPALHGLHRVARQVQEHLREAGAIGFDLGDRGVVDALEADLVGSAIELEQVDHVVEQLVHVHGRQLESIAAGEDHELVDQSP